MLLVDNDHVHFSIFHQLTRKKKWSEIMQLVERHQGIPQIVGAIDGIHIPVAIPPNKNGWQGEFPQC
ncbi:hypothetical protein VP01_1677g3 [Puccinia sorghi]|uniref:DDE Tnp4 domain-containing protein n=1 Tax=Puccinia sorghi TaxID=27349 RepID=A0A0L6VG31_9BASI|nr:hypothetical protein VP01_1677g3 [Puccinia sorghi]